MRSGRAIAFQIHFEKFFISLPYESARKFQCVWRWHNPLFVFFPPQYSTSVQWNLIHSIKTMNWTKVQASPNLTHEQIAVLTTLGPSAHPHSALLPSKIQFLRCPPKSFPSF